MRLRTLTLPVLLASLVSTLPVPRPAAGQALEVGLRAGVNRATVAWDPTPLGEGFDELHARTAFTGGASVSLGAPLGFRVRAEASWTGKGFREVAAGGDETRLELAYLEVPLLLARRLRTGGPVTPELYAGPYWAREVSCRIEGEVEGESVGFDCDEVPGDPVERRTAEWGAVGGVALHVGNASGPRVVVDLRYTRGLRNVDGAPTVDNLNTRHRGLGVTAGVTVPLGGR